MPMPESFVGYVGCVLGAVAVGGLGAGRLGMRFKSFAGIAGAFPGTGGGARGFSKLPS